MNILPKKRWHVRTKENIARVRRDEAKAAEEEKAKQDRIKLAEREARRELLLQRSRKNTSPGDFVSLNEGNECERDDSRGHINFFKELEDGSAELKQSNKEHDKEQKEEREKYEKQIGYLTYLGQDTNEALGKKNWYDVAPDRSDSGKSEINLKSKIREDPLEIIKKYTSVGKAIDDVRKSSSKIALYKPILNKSGSSPSRKRKRRDSSSNSDADNKHKYKKSKHEKKRHKKDKSKKRYISNSDSSENSDDEAELEKKQKLEILRLERIKREKGERRRTEEFLAKLRGEENKPVKETSFKPKYNSQFNPELAKQNYDKNR
ncbi:leukocyte receptor cluster member 1 homolog [Anoplophora glabripennis]|uniref:leukocyte receptor cluster member 1 homolog n=1 Tax=Anoplophora glabripennis TaxID=217634 RepID=UPI0008753588|nr:leukocyte receptor cluster member 1 homolog [Anoplophora glabripennis]